MSVANPPANHAAGLALSTSDQGVQPDAAAQLGTEAMASGPGLFAWIAPLATMGVGLFAVALVPADDTRWALLAVASVLVPMLPTTAFMSWLPGRRPVFELWQIAVATGMLRSFTSLGAVGAAVMMADAPVKPFVWIFLLVAGVALAAEKLVILGTSRVAASPSEPEAGS